MDGKIDKREQCAVDAMVCPYQVIGVRGYADAFVRAVVLQLELDGVAVQLGVVPSRLCSFQGPERVRVEQRDAAVEGQPDADAGLSCFVEQEVGRQLLAVDPDVVLPDCGGHGGGGAVLNTAW